MRVRRGMRVMTLDYGDTGTVVSVDRSLSRVTVRFIDSQSSEVSYYHMPLANLKHAITGKPLVYEVSPSTFIGLKLAGLGVLGLAAYSTMYGILAKYAPKAKLASTFKFQLDKLSYNWTWKWDLPGQVHDFIFGSVIVLGVACLCYRFVIIFKDGQAAKAWRGGRISKERMDTSSGKPKNNYKKPESGKTQKKQGHKTVEPTQEEKSAIDKAYETLGLSMGASRGEIKEAYHTLVKTYHPDAVASMDLTEAQRQLFSEKFIELKSAYELLIK